MRKTKVVRFEQGHYTLRWDTESGKRKRAKVTREKFRELTRYKYCKVLARSDFAVLTKLFDEYRRGKKYRRTIRRHK